jgi:formylglycine-generating enzyme required for sulfatase activity
MKKSLFRAFLALLALLRADCCRADLFGGGTNSFEIEFVTIGQPGNVADTTGDPNPAGAVPYEYRIGKYEISEQMIDKANALGGLGITKDTRGPNKPATRVSWYEAATFVNWLNTSTGATPAYKFDADGTFQLWLPTDPGYDPANLYRNSLTKYFLPSADEWYKAAFFDPVANQYFDFPNGSDTAPAPVASGIAPSTAVFDQPFEQGPADITLAGGLSPYGTMAQGGNVWEWEEMDFDLINDSSSSVRGVRGGFWNFVSGALRSSIRNNEGPGAESRSFGFRVASVVPEPSTLLLGGMAAGVLLRRRGGSRKGKK